MYSVARTCARPPQIIRCPRFLPLSRLSGATPTRLLICLCVSAPSSGKFTSKVLESTAPTPGTLGSQLTRASHNELCSMLCLSWASSASSRSSSQAMWASISCCMALRTVPNRFFSAVSISTIWRRWVTNSAHCCDASFAIRRTSGWTASAKCAST